MKNGILYALIATCSLVFISIHGELGANGEDGHTHTSESHQKMDHADMTHGKIELSDSENVPTVDLHVYKDAKNGWNIQVITENFRFAPEHASTPHVPGEGHGHIYVDGKKINRLYGEWYHIEYLSPGTHEIEVTLNANSHDDLAVDGVTISDIEIVTVPAQ
jgi:hypothetical protein